MSRARLIIAITIFLVAFGVRLLTWHDTRLTVGKVQSSVVQDYQRVGRLLRQDGLRGFFSSSSSLADLNNLGHPPGYSVLLAFIESTTAIQLIQIIFDAGSAVLIFLIVAELFSTGTATVAGALAAFSPQLAWNSVLLLPDSLAVFPILLAVFLLARARKNPHILNFIGVGVLVGISCWLRANAMLLTVFLAAAAPLLGHPTNFSLSLPSERHKLKFVGQRWQLALAIVAGTLLIVLPLTIRNAIVFHRFIPLSLGGGQTLLEGIADYDTEGRFGIPNTDMGIMKQEAEMFQRPEYYGTLFNPDGVERERWRLSRGFGVIRSHPFWFAGVMTRRAASMLRLERTRLISPWPAVSHSLDLTNAQTAIINSADLVRHCLQSSSVKMILNKSDVSLATIEGDDSKNGTQLSFCPVPVIERRDYVLELPIRIEQGRMRVSIRSPNVSEIIEPREAVPPNEQPTQLIRLPFVGNGSTADVEFSNEASSTHPLLHIGEIKLYELGPSRWLWTRYPRLVIHAIQRLFITAILHPLAILGLGIVILRKQSAPLVMLSVIPVYYFCVQSTFHTEYRYVLAMNYFVFAFASLATTWIAISIKTKLFSLRQTPVR